MTYVFTTESKKSRWGYNRSTGISYTFIHTTKKTTQEPSTKCILEKRHPTLLALRIQRTKLKIDRIHDRHLRRRRKRHRASQRHPRTHRSQRRSTTRQHTYIHRHTRIQIRQHRRHLLRYHRRRTPEMRRWTVRLHIHRTAARLPVRVQRTCTLVHLRDALRQASVRQGKGIRRGSRRRRRGICPLTIGAMCMCRRRRPIFTSSLVSSFTHNVLQYNLYLLSLGPPIIDIICLVHHRLKNRLNGAKRQGYTQGQNTTCKNDTYDHLIGTCTCFLCELEQHPRPLEFLKSRRRKTRKRCP